MTPGSGVLLVGTSGVDLASPFIVRRFSIVEVVVLLVIAACNSSPAGDSVLPQPSSPSTTGTTEAAARTVVEPLLSDAFSAGQIQLTILAVRPNDPSLALFDVDAKSITIYPPGSHALPLDAIDGAVMTPDRQIIIWTQGVATLFSDSLDQAGVDLGPNPPRSISGFAPSLVVVPSPQLGRAWLVQPGIGYAENNHPTLIDLVDLETGSVLWSTQVDPNAFPVAATEQGLVLSTERLVDTGDGWVSEPGSQHVLLVTELDGGQQIGAGIAVAANHDTVARFICPPDKPECVLYRTNELVLTDTDGDNPRQIPKPSEGTWMAVGGPSIPSDATPLQTVSPDGSKLLIRLGKDLDVNASPTHSTLLIVDLKDGTTRPVAQHQTQTPSATWSHDGEWIVIISGNDITLINFKDPDVTITLPALIPTDHYVLAAG